MQVVFKHSARRQVRGGFGGLAARTISGSSVGTGGTSSQGSEFDGSPASVRNTTTSSGSGSDFPASAADMLAAEGGHVLEPDISPANYATILALKRPPAMVENLLTPVHRIVAMSSGDEDGGGASDAAGARRLDVLIDYVNHLTTSRSHAFFLDDRYSHALTSDERGLAAALADLVVRLASAGLYAGTDAHAVILFLGEQLGWSRSARVYGDDSGGGYGGDRAFERRLLRNLHEAGRPPAVGFGAWGTWAVRELELRALLEGSGGHSFFH